MLVSILIPCFNAERWIGQAIDSALGQTYTNIEVVVVDDGSTDNSLSVIKSFGNRIRWVGGANFGGNAARNRLLELANGEWLQYLDADDYLLSDKVARQMEYLTIYPDTDVLYGQVTKENWTEGGSTQDLQVIAKPHDPWVLLARWYLPQTGGPLWRKAALNEVGGWKPDQPCCQEHELYSRLLIAGKRFTYCPHNGAIYRIWSNNTVCHRDESETRRQKLKILTCLELHLLDKQKMTTARREAISQARFEVARLTWASDPAQAKEIVRMLLRADSGFQPLRNQPGGHHPPMVYLLLWKFFGFSIAENFADFYRLFRRALFS